MLCLFDGYHHNEMAIGPSISLTLMLLAPFLQQQQQEQQQQQKEAKPN